MLAKQVLGPMGSAVVSGLAAGGKKFIEQLFLPGAEELVSGSFRHSPNADGRMLMRQDFQKGTERGGEKLKTPTQT